MATKNKEVEAKVEKPYVGIIEASTAVVGTIYVHPAFLTYQFRIIGFKKIPNSKGDHAVTEFWAKDHQEMLTVTLGPKRLISNIPAHLKAAKYKLPGKEILSAITGKAKRTGGGVRTGSRATTAPPGAGINPVTGCRRGSIGDLVGAAMLLKPKDPFHGVEKVLLGIFKIQGKPVVMAHIETRAKSWVGAHRKNFPQIYGGKK